MSTFTEHYNLILPSTEDYYDIQDFNENTEALDGLLYEQEQAMAGVKETAEEISQKIGSPEDEGEDTLFGVLANQSSTEPILVPSDTVQRVLLQNITVPYNNFNILLLNFIAPKDGIVCIDYTMTGGPFSTNNSTAFHRLSGDMDANSFTMPEGSIIESGSFPIAEYSYQTTYYLSTTKATEKVREYVQVKKGQRHLVRLNILNCANKTLSKAELCYEETTGEA